MRKAETLNEWDRGLLDRYLRFYRELDNGNREPTTAAQKRFVQVCQNNERPRNQHEIAYSRFKLLESQGPSDYTEKVTRKFSAPLSLPAISRITNEQDPNIRLQKITPIDVVDYIEVAEYQPSTSASARSTMDRIKHLYIDGKAKAQSISADGSVWLSTILADKSFSLDITHYLSGQYGHLSNVYTKAMDGSFLEPGSGMAPLLHRLFEGHAPLEAWQRVQDALPDDSFWQEAQGYIEAMWSDMVTPAGMPLFTFSPENYASVQNAVASLNIPADWVRDVLNYDAVELVQGVVPIIPMILCWNDDDAERFAKLAGALAVGSVVAANPLAAVVAVVMIARGVHQSRDQQGFQAWASGLAKGGSVSASVLIVSSIIGGPAWIGLIVAVAIGIFLSRQIDNFSIDDVSKFVRVRLQEALSPA